jgi:hypothetical protein
VIHGPLYPVKIGSILNFEEWARTANSSSTNLRKAEFFYLNSFKGYEFNTNGILSSFCQFYLVQNVFRIIITNVFDDGESIDNAFFTIEKFFFYHNHIISDCTILFSYVITLLTWNTYIIFHEYL